MELEKIEEGSFARLEGNIYIVIGSYERNRPYDLCVQLGNFETKEFEGEEYQSKMIISKNIIDLIKVGDIIETFSYGFVEIYKDENGKLCYELAEHMPPYECLQNNEIKSVITKEQIEEIKYKVKE